MAKEKSIVEEAIIQMKNLEEAVAENAKGILASTMKEEIKELVKESLTEQEDEVEDETEIEAGTDDSMNMNMDMDMGGTDDEEEDMGDEEDEEGDDEEEDDVEDEEEDAIDLTDKSDAEVLRVFKLMGPDDNIVVTKDESGNINIKDEDKEYMIVGESIEDMELEEELDEMYDESDLEEEMDIEDVESDIEDIFSEETLYELELDPEDPFMGDSGVSDLEEDMDSKEETVYEIDLGGDDLEEDYDLEEEDEFYEEDDFYEEEGIMESKKKMSFKAKGKVGKGPKFSYETGKGGFKTVKKTANKTMGTGSAKKGFSYDKNGENLDGEFKIKPKKTETKEAARTLGNGSNFRKGGLPKPRAHSKANTAIKENFDFREVELLREKNEEYRKALNVFRNKLNEVAVFNSNLAYATRLFTEHSTSKQEKINILRRFDGVETIKESKNLYQTIKDELSVTTSKGKSNVNESVERVIEKSQSTGSATNLIESKTYENPQFLRMKDLMAKIK